MRVCITAFLALFIVCLAAYGKAANDTPAQALPADSTMSASVGRAQDVHTNATDWGPIYPLRASRNNRYLVDQNDRPFLMVGDSPQSLITNLSPAEAAIYMANRKTH